MKFNFQWLAPSGVALAVLGLVVSTSFWVAEDDSNPVELGTGAWVGGINSESTGPRAAGAALGEAADDGAKVAGRQASGKVAWKVEGDEPVMAAFVDWCERYRGASGSAERAALEAEGVERARGWRGVMATLIQTDPERAVKAGVPSTLRRQLPAAVVALLETPVAGHGDLAVLAALPEVGREGEVDPVWRTAEVNGREYRAYVYGRRLDEPTRRNIPLHGVAIDTDLAVHEQPVRVLTADEAAPVLAEAGGADCDVCLTPTVAMAEPVVVEVGSRLKVLCCPEHAAALADELTEAESGPPNGADPEAPVEASAWTEGTKKVILIRVDFPDLIGVSLTDTAATSLVTNLNTFFQDMSYGKAGFTPVGSGSAVTPVFRLTNTAAYYGSNNFYSQLRTDARAAATAAGYVLADYTHDVICMGAVPGFGWSGLGYVGSAGAWLRNSFSTGVAGHELGHNFGISHAGFWNTSGQSIIGPGATVEYGDSFDTMGAASAENNHFNVRYKNILNWIPTAQLPMVTASGTYRIFAQDQALTSGARGLGIAKDSAISYWVEFRQKFTANRWLMNGAGIRWTGNGTTRSQLLDTTPGSPDARTDAALVIGRTFSDPAAGVHITPIGKGGTIPESLDVVVKLGSFAGNRAPTATVTAATTAAATGVSLDFQVSATDADGDPLAYYWDFGNGTFGTNQATARNSWTTAGEYVVRCTVSDMKGGEVSDSVLVTIGAPTTYRISGQVTNGGVPVHGARVSVSTTRVTSTDSDGTYTLTGLPAGTYTASATQYPYTFAATGFANPITVGPNASGINFLSATVVPPTVTTPPLSQAVAPGSTVTFSVAATGTQPFSYQWRFNGNLIAGATAASYTRSNLQAADAGNYSVTVTNSAGSATSGNGVLTVNIPPTITTQPQSRDTLAGTNVTFGVTAAGAGPLSYQWRLNGTNIAGATAASYTRLQVQPADAGDYSVVVRNDFGSVTSTNARLGVNFGLTAQATSGGRVTVTPALPSYPAGTTVTLTADSLSAYTFSGWTGSVTGSQNPLTLTVNSNLNLTAQFTSPVADVIVDNPNATFTGTWSTATSATDKYAANYRTVGGSSNTASATATFTPTIPVTGRYDVHVWTPTLSKSSAGVPVLITHAGGSQTVLFNEATGTGNWRLLASGVPFNAGTSGSVRFANNIGQRNKTVIADAVCWVYSPEQAATPPQILTQPQDLTVTQGDDAMLTVEAGGSGPLSYQWRLNGLAIEGATDATLLLTAAQPEQAGEYSVVVQNSLGQELSDSATLTLLGSPVVLSEPASLAVAVGDQAVFAVTAQGAAPLVYRWSKDDVALSDDAHFLGTDSPTLTLNDALPTHAGVYTVTVSNPLGAVTSSMVFLSVGFEGDIVPAPFGDNRVLTHDQEYLGQALTGLVQPTGEMAFARLDSAPRSTLGDGVLALGDWVQAGRYVAGLDAPTPAGGPGSSLTSSVLMPSALATSTPNPQAPGQEPPILPVLSPGQVTLRMVADPTWTGSTTAVTVEIVSQGEVNAAAFLLSFDPSVLKYQDILWVDQLAAPMGTLNLNESVNGRIAVVAGRPAGQTFPAGSHPLLRLTFGLAEPTAAPTEVGVGALPGLDSLAGIDTAVTTASFESAMVSPPPPPTFDAITFRPDGKVELTITGSPSQRCAVEASADLVEWTDVGTVTNTTGVVTVIDNAGAGSERRFYRVGVAPE